MAKIIRFTSAAYTETTSLEFINRGDVVRFFVSEFETNWMSVDIELSDIPDIISELQKIVDKV